MGQAVVWLGTEPSDVGFHHPAVSAWCKLRDNIWIVHPEDCQPGSIQTGSVKHLPLKEAVLAVGQNSLACSRSFPGLTQLRRKHVLFGYSNPFL